MNSVDQWVIDTQMKNECGEGTLDSWYHVALFVRDGTMLVLRPLVSQRTAPYVGFVLGKNYRNMSECERDLRVLSYKV